MGFKQTAQNQPCYEKSIKNNLSCGYPYCNCIWHVFVAFSPANIRDNALNTQSGIFCISGNSFNPVIVLHSYWFFKCDFVSGNLSEEQPDWIGDDDPSP